MFVSDACFVATVSSQVLACKDSGYDWFEQLLQNVSWLTPAAVLIS